MGSDLVTLFLCGDVMLGRGVDQILPHPGDPRLRESHLTDARAYVELAQDRGPVPRSVDFSWPWGDSLQVLDEVAPDVRVINLETSVTRSDEFAPGKGVHYRMNPANLPCLAAARPDACVLANNHVLDFGRQGLVETLDALAAAGLRAVGAGRDITAARRPAVVTAGAGRVLVFSLGAASSGIPASWAATPTVAGVDFLPALSVAAADDVVDRVQRHKREGDIVVVSIHWGSNWGYGISRSQVQFAHRLIDGGVDVVHGHSSHHSRPIEVYRDKLVLYGCGDFLNDYEGISGHEQYRGDLVLMYFPALDEVTGQILALRMIPLRVRKMQLTRTSAADARWLQERV